MIRIICTDSLGIKIVVPAKVQYELRLRRLSRERDKKLQMLGMLTDAK